MRKNRAQIYVIENSRGCPVLGTPFLLVKYSSVKHIKAAAELFLCLIVIGMHRLVCVAFSGKERQQKASKDRIDNVAGGADDHDALKPFEMNGCDVILFCKIVRYLCLNLVLPDRSDLTAVGGIVPVVTHHKIFVIG